MSKKVETEFQDARSQAAIDKVAALAVELQQEFTPEVAAGFLIGAAIPILQVHLGEAEAAKFVAGVAAQMSGQNSVN